MKKIISVIITAVMIVNCIPQILLISSAASSCPKGHTYVEHYCKTCNKYETNYTGLAKKGSTWYYVKNGKADSTYTSLTNPITGRILIRIEEFLKDTQETEL